PRASTPSRPCVTSRPRLDRPLVLLVLSYMPMLWLVSSLAGGFGLVPAVAGLAILGWTLVLFTRGNHQPFLRLYFATLLGSVAILGIELLLWLAPGTVGGRVANLTFSG